VQRIQQIQAVDGSLSSLSPLGSATCTLLEVGWDMLSESCDDLTQEVLGHRICTPTRLAAPN
jgi:hypothetical protein